MDLIVLKGSEVTVNTSVGNTCGNTWCVRLVNIAAAVVVTQKDSGGNTIGTFTITNTTPCFVRKQTISDTFTVATGTIVGAPVGFT